MDLDNITDIEVLRRLLKNRMTKCVKSFEKKGKKFIEGYYYDTEQDLDYVYILFDDKVVELTYNEVVKYFE